jgi:cytochrome d ubiquinol oxidase subunit I
MGLAAWFGFVWWRRRRLPRTRWFLRAVAVSGAAAVLATWAGWVVTEVGRQPWIVNGYLRTEDAVTPNGGLWWWFAGVVVLYGALGTTAVLVLRRMSRGWRDDRPTGAPYAPDPADEPVVEGATTGRSGS